MTKPQVSDLGWPAFRHCRTGEGVIRVPRFAVDMMQTDAVRVSVIGEESVPRIKRSRRHGR